MLFSPIASCKLSPTTSVKAYMRRSNLWTLILGARIRVSGFLNWSKLYTKGIKCGPCSLRAEFSEFSIKKIYLRTVGPCAAHIMDNSTDTPWHGALLGRLLRKLRSANATQFHISYSPEGRGVNGLMVEKRSPQFALISGSKDVGSGNSCTCSDSLVERGTIKLCLVYRHVQRGSVCGLE